MTLIICMHKIYRDWTYEVTTHQFNYRNYHILNSGLGGSGDERDNNCVNDGPFAKGNYIPYDCSRTGRDRQCCLQRAPCSNNEIDCEIYTASQMIQEIIRWDFYGADGTVTDSNGYRQELEANSHAFAHNVIGGGGHLGLLLVLFGFVCIHTIQCRSCI